MAKIEGCYARYSVVFTITVNGVESAKQATTVALVEGETVFEDIRKAVAIRFGNGNLECVTVHALALVTSD